MPFSRTLIILWVTLIPSTPFPSRVVARSCERKGGKRAASATHSCQVASGELTDIERIVKPALRSLGTIAAAALLLIGTVRLARAAGDISIGDLQATTRALGFLDSLPNDGTIVVGLVFSSNLPESKAAATEVAGWLTANMGRDKSIFRPKLVSVDALVQGNDRLDAIFLMPGLTSDAATIAEAMRRRHLVSISTDPACLETSCCVLMVHADHGVEIVLDMAVAEAVGARFSTVFTMMVKRK